jgi:poly(hydroxyalkanoate) granule-associated protein
MAALQAGKWPITHHGSVADGHQSLVNAATTRRMTDMTETKVEPEAIPEQAPEETKGRPTPLLDAARKVLLAGIGAAALAADEIEDFVNKLVERGEIAEQDGRKLVKDVLERRRELSPLEQSLDRQLDRLLARLNVPTKADVDALNASIAELTEKIDALKKK